MAGVDPRPLTLRQLCWMAEARQRAEWSRTANIMALLANVNRDPKKRGEPYQPRDFDPYAPTAKPVEAPITALQALLPTRR